MTADMWIVVAILAGAVVLFVTEWLRVDLVAAGIVLALVLTGTLTTTDALAGFSNSSVLTIAFLFVVGGAVQQTGLASAIGRQILRVAGTGEVRLLVVLMVAVAGMSGFMSNTGTVAVLLPAVAVLARQIDVSPSRLLIPLSFGSMLGGAATLIGTPPNLMVNDALMDAGMEPFGFFAFAPMGLVLIVVGTAVMALLGRRLLPDRREPTLGTPGESPAQLAERYHLPQHLHRIRVPAGSALVGQTIGRTRLRSDFGVDVFRIMRPAPHARLSDLGHNRATRKPRDTPIVVEVDTGIEADDWLIVGGSKDEAERAAAHWDAELHPPKPKDVKALVGGDVGVAEVIVRQRSRLVGQTLAEAGFGDRYKLGVLEIRRPPQDTPLDRRTAPLRFGDVLLVQGWWDQIARLARNRRDVIVVSDPGDTRAEPHQDRAGRAGAILAVMVLVMALGRVPGLGDVSVVTTALAAAVAMVLAGCITMDEAYDAIDLKSVVLIAGVLPVSTAMEQVGLVDLLSTRLVDGLGGAGPYALMAGLFLVTAGFTQVISNTATAVIIAPLALTAAQAMGIEPHAYLMTVAVAASSAFVSPVASPTNTLVMGAGSYRFGDYVRVGLPMLGMSLVVSMLLLPVFFPF